jgi:myo-inositol 2-dehydrogenase / D-chiro-inositol 1-dehydrogenase
VTPAAGGIESEGASALIIGSGRMARIRLDALVECEDICRYTIATRNPERASDLSANGVRVVDTADLRDVETPTLVLVTSATAHHDDDVKAALSFGCPVLCEKPLAEHSAGGRELAELATAEDVPLHVAFQRHFEPPLCELRRRIVEAELGVLYHLRFTHFDYRPSRREFIAASGGIFRDLLVHDIECALWLTQRSVRSVFATGTVRKWLDYEDFGDCDTATALLTLDDGLSVTLHGTRHHPLGQDARVEAVGSAGAASVGLTPATPIDAIDATGVFDDDPPLSFRERFAPAFVAETLAFADFALGRAERFDGVSATAAVEAARVAEACELSRQAQRVVELASVI